MQKIVCFFTYKAHLIRKAREISQKATAVQGFIRHVKQNGVICE